jgi:hypothetical protein
MIEYVVIFIMTAVVGLVSWIFPEQAKYVRNEGQERKVPRP